MENPNTPNGKASLEASHGRFTYEIYTQGSRENIPLPKGTGLGLLLAVGRGKPHANGPGAPATDQDRVGALGAESGLEATKR